MKKVISLISFMCSFQNSDAQCWLAVTSGDYHALAIKNDNTLWAWGENSRKQLGDSTQIQKNTPIQIGAAADWKHIAASRFGSYAIKNDGTLWNWGQPNTLSGYPLIAVPSQVGTDTDWKFIVAGRDHLLILKNNGTLWSCGSNTRGQSGNGTFNDDYLPTRIGTDTDWKFAAAGLEHSLAIKLNGTLWAWGDNGQGQIADSISTTRLNTPKKIGNSSDWDTVACGNSHSLALKTDGTLWAWGSNNSGELGNGLTGSEKYSPVQITQDTDWKLIDGGNNYSLAIKTNGTLWGWGTNSAGQLGDGTTITRHVPIQSGSTNGWAMISAGNYASFAAKNDRSLWAFGGNGYGILGDGSGTDKTVPTQINCTVIGINEINDMNKISLFPNPTVSFLSVKSKIHRLENSVIEIRNYLGQIVMYTNSHESIDVSQLSNGMYNIQIHSQDGKILNGKFIKN